MAFIPYKYMKGNPPHMLLPADDATYTVGQALVFSSGQLATVSNGVGEDIDEGPHFICMQNKVIETAGDLLEVIKADENIIWESGNDADTSTLTPGTKYTISDDGLWVTTTTTKGCFLVLDTAGTGQYDVCHGIFVDSYNENS